MSTPENPFEIDRFTPELKADIAGDERMLNYDNTTIFKFGRVAFLNHIKIQSDNPNEEDNFVFNCDMLITILEAYEFPIHSAAYPSEGLVDFYMENTVADLDSEMEGLDEQNKS